MPPSFDANATLGALQIGVLISCFLFGIVTVQVFVYFVRFTEDRLWLKSLVAITWLFELAHTICVCHSLYIMTIVDFGHPEKFIKTPDSLSIAIIFSGFIGPLVQGFFAQRLRVVSGRLYIPIICWFLSGLRLLGSIVAAGEGVAMHTLAEYEEEWLWLLTSILAVGACVDVTVAASLCFYLQQKKEGSFKGTAGVIDKLIAYTIQTGLLTSIAAVIMLICFVAMKDNLVWLAFFMFLARLFSNTLLASLNARSTLRSHAIVEISPSDMGRSTNTPTVAVRMTKMTKVTKDSDSLKDRAVASFSSDSPAHHGKSAKGGVNFV